MPQVKKVNSLARACLNCILENQEFFNERFTFEELKNGVRVLDSDQIAVNPFAELPTELLEELIALLRKRESCNKYNIIGIRTIPFYKITPLLKMLMTPNLRTLNLKWIAESSIDISDVLHLATIRCPDLETLQLDPSTHLYITSFNFIVKFVKLRCLDISFPEAGDDCLGLIGSHCPDLRELICRSGYMYGCGFVGLFQSHYDKVTDDGIRKLCVVGNCKSIRLLSLEGCENVTTRGIQIALDNLPQLRVLRHESLLECLAEIAQTATDKKLKLPQYSLSSLYISYYTNYKTGSLLQSVLLCPNVTQVYVHLWNTERFENTELLNLLLLEKLITLVIVHSEFGLSGRIKDEIRVNRGLTFDGVLPLLKKFGCSLKKLNLNHFSFVDVSAIIEFCPNLEYLIIDHCRKTSTQSAEIKVEPILKYLKKIHLWKYFTHENLFALLSSPSLEVISIVECDSLTDRVLKRAAKLNSFHYLKYLNIHHCYSVGLTKKGIFDIFLKESNLLRKIDVAFTINHPITREDLLLEDYWMKNPFWIEKNWQFIFTFKRNLHFWFSFRRPPYYSIREIQ